MGKLALAIMLIGGTVAFASWYMRPEVVRYRLTVEIDTPRGPKSGSAVQQLTFRREPRLTPESGGWSVHLKGEAVPVEVAPGRTVYALLKSPTGNYPWELLRHTIAWSDSAVRLRTLLRQASTAELQPDAYPVFVTFAEPDDPATVEVMDASQAHVRRMTLTMTDDPVTTGISSGLPWLTEVPERRLISPVDPYNHSIAAGLTHGDFIRDGK